MSDSWVIVTASGGVFDDVITSEDDPAVLLIDYDETDPFRSEDYKASYYYVMEVLEWIREMMPPGSQRKALRAEVVVALRSLK